MKTEVTTAGQKDFTLIIISCMMNNGEVLLKETVSTTYLKKYQN